MIGLPFADRREAGEALAGEVRKLALQDPVVLALPRGGVPVGYEVARAIGAPLEILLVRKVGAPGHEEFGIGALVDGAPPQLVLDDAAARTAGASHEYLARQVALQLKELERRRAAYHSGPPIALDGKAVVVVDDGIATGNTVKAALQALAALRCGSVVLAVPVAPREVLAALKPLCDEVVCLGSPEPFFSVGTHYRDFTQTSDEEVIRLLAAARKTGTAPG